MRLQTKFDICKEYFFIFPSIQVITSRQHKAFYKTGFIVAFDIDWLVFHLNFKVVAKENTK